MVWLTSLVASAIRSIALTDRKHIDPNYSLLTRGDLVAKHNASKQNAGLPILLWRIPNFAALSPCRSQSAEFVKYDSVVGWKFPYFLLWGDLSVPMPNGCRTGKTATVWGTKAKPSVSPKPRRLCCPLPNLHSLMSDRVMNGQCETSDRRQRGL